MIDLVRIPEREDMEEGAENFLNVQKYFRLHENLKWAYSKQSICMHVSSVLSDSLRTQGLQLAWLLCSRDFFSARILKWVTISSSRGSTQSRDQSLVSCIVSHIGRQLRYCQATWETPLNQDKHKENNKMHYRKISEK